MKESHLKKENQRTWLPGAEQKTVLELPSEFEEEEDMMRNNPLMSVPRIPSRPKRATTFQEPLSMQQDQEVVNEDEELGSIDIHKSEGNLEGYELINFMPLVLIEDNQEDQITLLESNRPELTNLAIWILQYQKRFKLPEISINVLIKSLRQILKKKNSTKYYDFPTSLYSARCLIGINSTFRQFAVCPACHKLYDIQQIKNAKSLPICENTKYPKHRTSKKRIACAQPLAIKYQLSSGVIF
jgi:hypothetical protein